MPPISNLATLAQMPMESIFIITSTSKDERTPEISRRRITIVASWIILLICYSIMVCVQNFRSQPTQARNGKCSEFGTGVPVLMGGGRTSSENPYGEKSNETTAATSDFDFPWAKMGDEQYERDENAEGRAKGDCKGTLIEKDPNP